MLFREAPHPRWLRPARTPKVAGECSGIQYGRKSKPHIDSSEWIVRRMSPMQLKLAWSESFLLASTTKTHSCAIKKI